MFLPFTVENAYVFAQTTCGHFSIASARRTTTADVGPRKFDWYDYWMNIHMPGAQEVGIADPREDMRAQPKRVYTYRDLLEMFETTTKRHEARVAMRIERDGHKEQYTYADLRELATRAAAFFASQDIRTAPG